MKKYLSLLLTSLLLFCTGCSSSPNVASIEDAPEPTDYTVAADTFDPSQYQQIGSFSSIVDLVSQPPTLEELAEQSDNIVYGRVLSTQNYDQSGRGQTLYTFEIQRSYRGNLLPGDTISVVADGGYDRLRRYVAVHRSGHFEDMTQQEIDASMIYSAPAMGAPLPEEGDIYLLFLDQPLAGEEYEPKGAYSEHLFSSRFICGEDGTLSRYVPEENYYGEGERSYTLEEMERHLSQLLAE